MSAGQQVLYLLRKAGMILAVLLLVTVFLSAMPGHRAPAVQLETQPQELQNSPAPTREMLSHHSPGIANQHPATTR